MDSYPQYADYFDQQEDERPSFPMIQPVGQKTNEADIPPRPILEDTENILHIGNNSERFQDNEPVVARNDDMRKKKDNELNRTALILEPGVDRYPHNTFR